MKNPIANRPAVREPDAHDTTDLSRRRFMLTSALATAGAGAAGLFKPSTAEAASGGVQASSILDIGTWVISGLMP